MRMPSLLLRSFLVGLCVLRVPSAGAQAGGDTVYHLRGAVIDSLTGKPLPRALVFSIDHRLATMTDREGHFALDVSVATVAATPPSSITYSGTISMFRGGDVQLMAKKPGFLDPEVPVEISFSDKETVANTELRLTPVASLAGRVSAASTDGAEHVRVSLFNHQVQDGSYRWTQVAVAETDSRGEYVFGHLKAGEYTAMTAEWRGDQPFVPPSATALSEEYPPAFFGDAADLKGAMKLPLHSGEVAHADLHLHLATYYPVTLPVSPIAPGSGVVVRVEGQNRTPGFALGYNVGEGAVRGALPNGSYTLLLASYGAQPLFASVPIHVEGAAVKTAMVTLAPEPRIPVRVRQELTRKGNSGALPINIGLRPDGDDVPYANGSNQPGHGDEFFIENVQPGRYRAQANAGLGYVAAMSSGGVDLLRDPLVISGSGTAEPIDVVIRDDSGMVSGKVTKPDGAGPMPHFVLLLPNGAGAQMCQGWAGPDGSFTIGNVPPGSYRVFAVDAPGTQLPYRDPQAMRAYRGKGANVTVTPGATVQVDAPLLEDTQEPVR